ncbi:hypothetical protein ACWCPT_30040 [Streptomyces sp. NPDC002308]
MHIDFNSLPDTRIPQATFRTEDQIIASLAYHEAGHTVTGMHFGMSLARTRIHTIPVGHRTGLTGATTWNHSRVLYFDLAVELAAGAAVTTRHLRENGLLNPGSAPADEAPHDRDMAVATFEKCGYPFALNGPAPEHGATWEQAITAATDMTDRLWDQITAVAEALIADPRRELSGDHVADLIGLRNPAPTN